jgi:hypothetical protein
MRLAVDKWGAIKPTSEVILADAVNTEKKISDVVYEELKSNSK